MVLLLPFLPYKIARTLDNSDYTMIKVYHSQMAGFVAENHNLEGESIYGNTPKLTTFTEGNPKYIDFNFYGTFKRDENNNVKFKVEKWYPSIGYVRLYDTILWEKYLRILYMIIVIPTGISLTIAMSLGIGKVKEKI
ncbi:hypothetical protein [Clostridium sardiniense]|uniref:hypothetical protein n=1 Tax=Clostridium sardiniense TaxID=29369 RepID=UPI00195E0293|nr:hypothetical protein [Clostridium sardiniense]MBM7833176.1 hypothetical protein [Clostridium sardiniense]